MSPHAFLVLRQKRSRGQVEARFANMFPCLICMEACVGAHHLSRRLKALGHDARLVTPKYVRPYSKGPSETRRRLRSAPPEDVVATTSQESASAIRADN